MAPASVTSPPGSSGGRGLAVVYAKLSATAVFWGGTFIAGRVVATRVPHLFAATGRFVTASVLLLLVARRWEGGLPRLTRRQALATFLLGLTGVFLYNVFFLGALGLLPAGRTALIIALNPIVTAIAGSLLLRERLGAVRWGGIALALVGAAVVITRGDLHAALGESIGRGETLMFLGVLAWAAYTILGQRAMRGLSPIAATTYASLWGCGLLALAALSELGELRLEAFDLEAVAAVVYLGAFGTVAGFTWYYQGVVRLGSGRAAVFTNLVPVSGVLLAALLLGEPILASMLTGGLLTVAGVMITNRPARRHTHAPADGAVDAAPPAGRA